MPERLREALADQTQGLSQAELSDQAQALSARYRGEAGTGKRLVSDPRHALAYGVTRMPATFAAVAAALGKGLAHTQERPRTLLDVGAGTGAAAWAAAALLELDAAVCIEREPAMHALGEALMANGEEVLRNARWIARDIRNGLEGLRGGLVVAAYVLGEMTKEDQAQTADMLWSATEQLLLLVEPGTPVGHRNLRHAWDLLARKGAHCLAPCPAGDVCPLEAEDWCHFACRVARGTAHRLAKGGAAPFEDEKYAYLLVGKSPGEPATARVLRHPQIHTGHVRVRLCTGEGVCERTVSSRDGEAYKRARKLKAGDDWA